VNKEFLFCQEKQKRLGLIYVINWNDTNFDLHLIRLLLFLARLSTCLFRFRIDSETESLRHWEEISKSGDCLIAKPLHIACHDMPQANVNLVQPGNGILSHKHRPSAFRNCRSHIDVQVIIPYSWNQLSWKWPWIFMKHNIFSGTVRYSQTRAI
jgi:hypothetical protein